MPNFQTRSRPPARLYGEQLLGIVQRTGLCHGKDVFGLGIVTDAELVQLLKNASAVVIPTLAEGGGSYPIEEALSLGVPVSCSDIPVLREQLAHRTARIGWFDPISVDSIVAALCDLVDHYAEYKASALAGCNDPRPTWEQIGRQYIDVFSAVLRGDR